MVQRYYIDTCIWIDLYEDRKGYNGEPLGEYALRFLFSILKKKQGIVISKPLISELHQKYTLEEVHGMMNPFLSILQIINPTKEQETEARKIAQERNIPPADALHAILAREYHLILVTRDNDFRKLTDISAHYKPENIM